MPRVSVAFFAAGTICVFIGMLWGMHMGDTNDMTLAPAHAHLNLLGWVTLALYGTFYAITRETMSARLAWTNFGLSVLGLLVMIPALTLFLANGNDPKFIPALAAGEGLSVAGLLTFAISVFRELLRRRA